MEHRTRAMEMKQLLTTKDIEETIEVLDTIYQKNLISESTFLGCVAALGIYKGKWGVR